MDIVKEISLEQTLCQTAEECAELAKACLKLQRILDGRNPTPITRLQAMAMIREEAQDVKDCLELLDHAGVTTVDLIQHREKMRRWERRITEDRKLEKMGANGTWYLDEDRMVYVCSQCGCIADDQEHLPEKCRWCGSHNKQEEKEDA